MAPQTNPTEPRSPDPYTRILQAFARAMRAAVDDPNFRGNLSVEVNVRDRKLGTFVIQQRAYFDSQ